jgi:leucyl/phenylalanyl-tRNA--protein transferase
MQRVALGTAWALMPKRAGQLVPLTRVWVSDLVSGGSDLPDATALAGTNEIAGIVRDLEPATLIEAYRRGLFPHGHFGPLKWVSSAERGVLFFDGFHVSKRVRAIMRQSKYTVTFDQDFESVIVSCAGRRRGRWHLTWITPRIMHAYARLYDEGHVHSFEVWNNDGVLVGGGYGVAIGRAFIIESQFFREPNASKIGFAVLAWHLAQWGFVLCDNKWLTPTTEQMGFVTLPRQEFLKRLAAAVEGPGKRDCWKPEAGPETVANWRPEAAAAA